MKRNLLIVLFLSAVLAGCGHGHTDKHNDGDHTHAKEQQQQAGLMLDHGKKWQINEEMRPYLQASEQLLQDYEQEGSGDYHALAAGLKENNNQLIASCTMKGESHEQLHVWLYPHLELVKRLETAQNNEEAEPVIRELYASFETFTEHFE